MQLSLLSFEPERKLYSVTELNARIRGLLDAEFGQVSVAGEISGVRLAPSGHYYFTLKDQDAQVKCACFRMTARYLKFKPQDGVSVVARGRLDVFEARGEYQLLVDHLEPRGHGALQLAFEQLKQKLSAEGLFDAARKRPLPALPRRIGIVTSPGGAVIQDMVQILSRRFPGIHIRLYPALVQGEGSIEQVCRGLRCFSDSAWADVVIVARGGGSLEDLWTFNEEAVARAIATCRVPVISAVGHETDFTIADFVADLRAPTPSAAAELVVRTREELIEKVMATSRALDQVIRYRMNLFGRRLHLQGTERVTATLHRRIGRSQQRVDEMERCLADGAKLRVRMGQDLLRGLDSRLRRMDLRLRFAGIRRALDAALAECSRSMALRFSLANGELKPLVAKLEQLSPVKILQRGYAIVRDEAGHVVKSPSETAEGSELRILLAGGELKARVTGDESRD